MAATQSSGQIVAANLNSLKGQAAAIFLGVIGAEAFIVQAGFALRLITLTLSAAHPRQCRWNI
jgi:hypothetical protein